MESSTTTLLLLRHHHHHPPTPPPPPPPPWRFPISLLSHSSHSRLLFLPLHRCLLGPIGARKFDFGPRGYDADADDDFGGGEFDRRRKSKRRRRRRSKGRQWWFDERERSERFDEREPSMLDQVVESLWFLKDSPCSPLDSRSSWHG
uniref:Uncharacterized protein n=1 Tax=Opuntia streptacantha TaxID=393608 RepID=A0A7C9EXG8_OPUST